ncbi:hypothetical protein [Paraflavitalea speifideaquila]|uniref:hypothetical protein n=1 Tax=Paraflavitalea speifideaquila TaxID=3076558 RepID=UPI0028EE4510|nr:hypothetical protein [Paraflavitalea speifideiaquila]
MAKHDLMAFYDLPKHERMAVVEDIQQQVLQELRKPPPAKTVLFFQDEDTYIRKSAYLSVGRIYAAHENLRKAIITMLEGLLLAANFKIRQTAINAAGEIGKVDFAVVQHFLIRDYLTRITLPAMR